MHRRAQLRGLKHVTDLWHHLQNGSTLSDLPLCAQVTAEGQAGTVIAAGAAAPPARGHKLIENPALQVMGEHIVANQTHAKLTDTHAATRANDLRDISKEMQEGALRCPVHSKRRGMTTRLSGMVIEEEGRSTKVPERLARVLERLVLKGHQSPINADAIDEAWLQQSDNAMVCEPHKTLGHCARRHCVADPPPLESLSLRLHRLSSRRLTPSSLRALRGQRRRDAATPRAQPMIC